jgi:hypothetical protein
VKQENRKKALRFLLFSLIILILILTFDSIAKLFILLLIVAANFFFALGKRFIPKLAAGRYFYGLELIMFSTVLTSVSFGPLTGAVMGGLLMVANYIGERRFSQYFLITTALYSMVGYFAYFGRSFDFAILGIAITLVYNLVVTMIVAAMEGKKTTMLVFNGVNILFNVFLFTTLGFLPEVI